MEQEIANQRKKVEEEKQIRQETKLRQKQEIEDRIRSRREEQARLKEIQEKDFQKVLKIKPKHVELEQNYQQYESLTMEERKARLKEIRSIKRPIDRNDINAHDQNYIRRKREIELEIKQNREATLKI